MHKPFDPIKWIQRLMDVNDNSGFSVDEKNTINHALWKLLEKLYASR